MASGGGHEGGGSAPPAPPGADKPPEPQFHMPTPEELRIQDVMNNCAVRTVLSGVMGMFSLQPHSCTHRALAFISQQ